MAEPSYVFQGPRDHCAYCGERADTMDHTVPQWFVRGNAAIVMRYRFVSVRACNDCNARAGKVVDKTFIGRRQRIAKSLRRRAARVLRTGFFDPEEVEEFGRGLRNLIEDSIAASEIVKRRLRNLDATLLPEGVTNDLWLRQEGGS